MQKEEAEKNKYKLGGEGRGEVARITSKQTNMLNI
jgi:hypothetical protein